ncbi:hypothetical protein [Streptomyces viridochromogenes]|uniref:Uncharacterized protein n=1 Tax=Streptomyces viridochromogenes Tue57 TaxID=1160705 RepID=L8PA58_STRVR|nr:hypothetical protein [Streptomyces viridochromogenes]ELS53048.1 hypothetical protein STVIR_6002 [Streptomyces viridochromogenes Tue57]
MSDQRRVIAEVRRTVRIYNLLVLVVGAIALVVAVDRAQDDVLVTSLEVVGTTLVSAALVSFIFGQITIRDTTLQVNEAIDQALREVLEPIRENLFAGALSRYRWDCHLDGLDPDGYAVQAMRVSYQVQVIPRELRFICVSSLTDESFSRLAGDLRYVLRWQVDEGLELTDPRCFHVSHVRVDGQQLDQPAPRPTTLRGSPAVEYRFQVSELRRHHGFHSVEFHVVARKYLGADREVRVQAYAFRSLLDAEYRLTVGESIGAEILNTQISGLSRIGAGGLIQHGRTYPDAFGRAAAYAIFTTPLQTGSNVVFTIDRGNPRRVNRGGAAS